MKQTISSAFKKCIIFTYENYSHVPKVTFRSLIVANADSSLVLSLHREIEDIREFVEETENQRKTDTQKWM